MEQECNRRTDSLGHVSLRCLSVNDWVISTAATSLHAEVTIATMLGLRSGQTGTAWTSGVARVETWMRIQHSEGMLELQSWRIIGQAQVRHRSHRRRKRGPPVQALVKSTKEEEYRAHERHSHVYVSTVLCQQLAIKLLCYRPVTVVRLLLSRTL